MGTGIDVFISIPSDQGELNVRVQASAPPTSTPLQDEAVALSCAAHLALRLNLANSTFLMDCLSLASFAALRNISATPWNIRNDLAHFFKDTSNLNAQVFHISREINGIAHSLGQQVFRSNASSQISCFAHAHSHQSCPMVSHLSHFQIQGINLHTIHCY